MSVGGGELGHERVGQVLDRRGGVEFDEPRGRLRVFAGDGAQQAAEADRGAVLVQGARGQEPARPGDERRLERREGPGQQRLLGAGQAAEVDHAVRLALHDDARAVLAEPVGDGVGQCIRVALGSDEAEARAGERGEIGGVGERGLDLVNFRSRHGYPAKAAAATGSAVTDVVMGAGAGAATVVSAGPPPVCWASQSAMAWAVRAFAICSNCSSSMSADPSSSLWANSPAISVRLIESTLRSASRSRSGSIMSIG